jgi:hypothetical protein
MTCNAWNRVSFDIETGSLPHFVQFFESLVIMYISKRGALQNKRTEYDINMH